MCVLGGACAGVCVCVQLLVISPGMCNCWLSGQKVTLANKRPYVPKQLLLHNVSIKVSECVHADAQTHICELRTSFPHVCPGGSGPPGGCRSRSGEKCMLGSLLVHFWCYRSSVMEASVVRLCNLPIQPQATCQVVPDKGC